ncbi:hypothetical protein RIU96_10760 [Corynebacterium sp. Z-1]|uniref:hypothetical protein n=1 Tax=Corynebacterium TaxID=1716 RepID=UPI002656AFCC|nr:MULTISPECIES: hypothetical protein [Corynebacterium]MDN8577205.1 hypothetical protein [Corynebacterium sanguinis]WNI12673.1 hypothetical protein RIU96_10760 [Corynebacterium sp. Z-1]
MIWQGSSLLDGPTTVAEATADAVVVGAVTLSVSSSSPADVRATAPDGSTFRVAKAGLTVSRYRAECAGRTYALNRTSGKRREILDAEGRVIARTRGLPNGDLEVDWAAKAQERGAGAMLDVVFMSWALTFVDAPTRRTLY